MSATAVPGHVTVRMYNVGFGDAFLVLFPGADRPRRVLIDCGTHFQGPGPRDLADVVAQIIEDVTDEDGRARIDLVVGTHRHQDHVKGFEESAWSDVEVREVWMPWTEDPDDADGRRILEAQSSTAKRVRRGLAALGFAADDPLTALVDNSLTNAKAMAMLHHGFAGAPRRRFLPRPRAGSVLRQRLLPGVRVHVLGPSRDAQVIRDMNPPEGESYLWLDGIGPGTGEAPARAPFTADWAYDLDAYKAAYGQPAIDAFARRRLDDLGSIDPFDLAVSLDKAVNGTSLVLVFEVGAAVLVFPGDAQWGTWDVMLRSRATRELLGRTRFLKVGHHGSHNATPVDFVEGLAEAERWAMVSTRRMERWEEIPKDDLMTALAGKSDHVARSDHGAEAPADGFTHWDDAVIEAVVPIA